VAAFVLSGVVPRFVRVRAKHQRVRDFQHRYHEFAVTGAPEPRQWLIARRTEMQRDAESLGQGVTMVAPPPVVGGGSYMPHRMFYDLFSEQSFSEQIGPQFRLDVLATLEHELAKQEADAKQDLWNPGAWLKLAFERLLRLPRYILQQAGFSERVVNSTGARIVAVLWSIAVGGSTIGGFILLVTGTA